MNFSIIIPTKNERNNLRKLLPILTKLYPHSPIFIVDDDSADDTNEFVNKLSKKYPQIHLILRKNKKGRGSAVLDGLKAAYKDKKISYFLEMDADFSHNPDEIAKLLKESLKTRSARWPADKTTPGVAGGSGGARHDSPGVKGLETIIIGSRHIPGAKFVNCSLLRVILSKIANWYIGLVLSIPKTVRHAQRGSPQGFPWGGGNKIADYTNGFRLYPRKAVEVLLNSSIYEKGYAVLSETAYILHKKGFKFKEVPTVFVNRTEGRSHATIFEFLHSIPAIIKIRKN